MTKRMENIAATCRLFLNLRHFSPLPFLFCFASLLLLSSNVSGQVQERDKSPERSPSGVASKGAANDAQLLDDWMGKLQNKDEKVRREAAKALGEMGDPAVEKVLYAVRHLASNIGRKRMATALPEFKNPLAVGVLERSLGGEDLPVIAGAYPYYIAKVVAGSKDREKVLRALIKAFRRYSDSSMAVAFTKSGDPDLAGAAQVWRHYQTRLANSSNAEEFMAAYQEAGEAGMNLSEEAGKTIIKIGPGAVEGLARMVNEQERALGLRSRAARILEDAIEEDRRIIDNKTVTEEVLKAACDPNQAVWTTANETLSRFGGNKYLEKPCRKR
jgi:hypothetical protein